MADDNVANGTILHELGRLRERIPSDSNGHFHGEKDDELRNLELEYKRLKKQKEELEQRVNEASLLKETQQVMKNMKEADEDEDVPLGKLANNDVLFKALELIKKKKLMEMYNAYRLTGIACVLLENDCLRFCLDTCYKGKYFESYYMEICMENDNIKILKHTIPFFIPIDEIMLKYNGPEGLKEFVFVISAHLRSFIARREQFSEAQETNEHYIIKDFYSTPAFDFVKFTLGFPSNTNQNVVKMKYTDLNDKLPKEVDVHPTQNDDDQELASSLQEHLLSVEVKKAIMSVVSSE